MTTIAGLQDFVDRHYAWARATFPDETVNEKLIHLRKEVEEVRTDPTDIMEYADCAMLLLHSLKLSGFTVHQLTVAMEEKFIRVQKIKTWVKSPDGDYQSVKEPLP